MPLHPDFIRTYDQNLAPADPSVWLPFSDTKLLIEHTGAGPVLLTEASAQSQRFEFESPVTLGTLDGVTYRTVEISKEAEWPEPLEWVEIRKLYGLLPLQPWLVAGYANQILHWIKTSRFCPVCGGRTADPASEWMRRCTSCEHERYPQVSPALLMLVHDGADGILMAHKPGWAGRYSIFAGFVLPGESLEECVHREVEEEAGVKVGELEYAGSQPWPFPNQLMIGFRAKYLSGEIKIDEHELDDARWFKASSLPTLPGTLSLSRQMIDTWAGEVLAGQAKD